MKTYMRSLVCWTWVRLDRLQDFCSRAEVKRNAWHFDGVQLPIFSPVLLCLHDVMRQLFELFKKADVETNLLLDIVIDSERAVTQRGCSKARSSRPTAKVDYQVSFAVATKHFDKGCKKQILLTALVLELIMKIRNVIPLSTWMCSDPGFTVIMVVVPAEETWAYWNFFTSCLIWKTLPESW